MASRILTTVVGSYPVPDWLAAMPNEQALLDATRAVFKIQENAGIDVVADGELYRFDVNHPDTNGMIDYFVRPLASVRAEFSWSELQEFRREPGMAFRVKPAGLVEGPIGEGSLNIPADYRRARALTRHPLKFTLTGPHMLCKTLVDRHYGSPQKLCRALADILAAQAADIDADIVQVDEANLPGHPEEAGWALDCINRVLDAVPTKAAVHLCFGNYGGQTIQQGAWEAMTSYLSGLHCDHVLLELAHRQNRELPHLAQVKPPVRFGLGVIDIKNNVVETPEQVARAIEAAAAALGEERIAFVNPDCGFWMLKRSIADRKIEALVRGRDLYEGRG